MPEVQDEGACVPDVCGPDVRDVRDRGCSMADRACPGGPGHRRVDPGEGMSRTSGTQSCSYRRGHVTAVVVVRAPFLLRGTDSSVLAGRQLAILKTHRLQQATERAKAAHHRTKCAGRPLDYVGLAIDGFDQKKTELPHIRRRPKDIDSLQYIFTCMW